MIAATIMFGDRAESSDIPSIVWGAVIASYTCLSGISLLRIARRDGRDLAAIDCLAQGVLISALAVHLGAGFVSWISLILLLIGLMALFVSSTRTGDGVDSSRLAQAAAAASDVSSVDQMLSKLKVPVCYTDDAGTIEEATELFVEAVDKRPEELIGENISRFVQDSDGDISLPTGKWWLHVVKESDRRYYHLLPTPDGRPPQEVKTPKRMPGDISFIDTESGLYTSEYRDIRGPEEVMRAQRYKRPLSSVLLELSFDSKASLQLSSDQIKMLKMAFAQKIKEVLRDTDSAFWMDDHDKILVLLPETQQQGAKSLISRLQMLTQEVFDDDIRAAISPHVAAGLYYCNGSNTTIDYGVFLASLEQSFIAAKEGQGS